MFVETAAALDYCVKNYAAHCWVSQSLRYYGADSRSNGEYQAMATEFLECDQTVAAKVRVELNTVPNRKSSLFLSMIETYIHH